MTTRAVHPPTQPAGMMRDRDWIAARIPHQGSMCLLDSVVEWDAHRVVCRALGHADPDNPLRSRGRLGAACGIEYAAQAMAVHGALLASANERPPPGFLASVRSTVLHVVRLDTVAGALEVEARCVTGDAATVLYDFFLRGEGRMLVEGRAAIVLDAHAAASGLNGKA